MEPIVKPRCPKCGSDNIALWRDLKKGSAMVEVGCVDCRAMISIDSPDDLAQFFAYTSTVSSPTDKDYITVAAFWEQWYPPASSNTAYCQDGCWTTIGIAAFAEAFLLKRAEQAEQKFREEFASDFVGVTPETADNPSCHVCGSPTHRYFRCAACGASTEPTQRDAWAQSAFELLSALHLAVTWELAPSIKDMIAKLVTDYSH